MQNKIVIAGGTGFIGKYIEQRFKEDGFETFVISRDKKHIGWNDDEALIHALDDAVCLINLAGKSVDCRYSERNKRLILDSRVNTTNKLQYIASQCKIPPKLWINSSTATIYRHADDRPMDEISGETGNGFSVEVAKAWERAFFKEDIPHTRKVALRIAIVLGKNGGVMRPYTHLVRSGLGGQQGNGKQMFSWIHIEDVYGIIRFIMQRQQIAGIYNCSAPNPVTNKIFMKTLRESLHPLIYLSLPKWLLQMGAAVIGTETELILKSRWVIPRKLLDTGFHFKYSTIDSALKNILKEGE